MNIYEAMNEYDQQSNKSVHTKRAYRNGLRVFVGYLQKKGVALDAPVESILPDMFINYPAWMGTQSYSKKTLGVYLSGVKSFMDWLTVRGYLELTYSQSVRWKMATEESQSKHESRLLRLPKRDDAKRMIEAVKSIPEPTPIKERNIAIILLLSSSGCRNEEITNFKVQDMNLEECTTSIIGKGNKERKAFFSHETAEAIKVYLAARNAHAGQPLFVRHDKGVGDRIEKVTTNTIRDVVKSVADFAGVKPFSPHWFRHALAIRLLEETHDLAMVQEILGHSDPATTRIYASIYPEKLQEAYQRVYG